MLTIKVLFLGAFCLCLLVWYFLLTKEAILHLLYCIGQQAEAANQHVFTPELCRQLHQPHQWSTIVICKQQLAKKA